MDEDAAKEALANLQSLEDQFALLLRVLDRDEVLRQSALAIRDAAGVDVGVVGRREGDAVVNRFVAGLRTKAVRNLLLPRGAGLGGKVFAARAPVIVRDYADAEGITHEFDAVMRREGLRGVMAVPVFNGDSVVGVLYGCSRSPTDFSGVSRQTIVTLASRAGVAVHAAEQAERTTQVRVAEDRANVALDLHDTVGQMLFSIGAIAQDLQSDLQGDDSLRRRVSVIADQASSAAAVLREALHRMTTPPAEVALAAALQADLSAFSDRVGVTSKFVAIGELPEVDSKTSETLLRCAREALHNVEKHAHATSVVISCYRSSDGLGLTIQDDGVGLESPGGEGNALGLASMRTRIERVGGRMSLVENEDGGFAVRLWLPC